MISLWPYVIVRSVKIGENAINLSPKSVRKIRLRVYMNSLACEKADARKFQRTKMLMQWYD
jgi:hypothetical protein